ncbi:DUF1684 domain-containing protein [Brachybacterium phenoliresistens]|uniref:DUF1684 domain-containing protein n=1 Tax=Brachybacterium phenoliresistens TaxID=396014 RepID=UPI0031E23BB1
MSTTPHSSPDPAATDAEAFSRAWQEWHRRHEERRREPLGFLAVTALHWLEGTPIHLPGAPGTWRLGEDGPEVELDPGEQLVLGATVITGRHSFGPLTPGTSITAAFLDDGVAGAVEIADRGGRVILRPRRADAPYLAAYPGTPAFPPDPRWRIPARLLPDAPARTSRVGSVVEGLEQEFRSPGVLELELAGTRHRLTAFASEPDGALSVLFRDATSGESTCAVGRWLEVPPPDTSGATVLDFTRAVNLPCAYTDHATCPLPPPENRLPVAVEAGERTPISRVTAAS